MTETGTGSFAELIASADTHVVFDLDQPARSLLILFGGIAGGVSMPVFEFFRLTADYPAKKAFLRDPRRAWYQLGLPRVGETAADVRRLLEAGISRSGAERVVMAGASAGGFAALLFGAWCGVDEVLAFSPQTFIDDEQRRRYGDDRWPEQIAHLHAAMTGRDAILDVLPVLPESIGATRFQVHVSDDDALDLLHAERIALRGGVDIQVHARGGHRLVKTLRDRGLLQPLLLEALRQ